MQYKIPVQIENEDTIFLGLSLRQLLIIVIYFGIGYVIYSSLLPRVGDTAALVPGIAIGLIGIFIALFKASEMTFVPFMLSLLRFNINAKTRYFGKGVDSYSPFEVGYVVKGTTTKKAEYLKKEFSKDKLEEAVSKI